MDRLNALLAKPLTRPALALGLLLLALLAFNVVASFIPLRLDMTRGSLYTLSDGSRAILAQSKEPITIKLFYSQSLPNLPVQIKQYANKVKELLKQYQRAGQVTVEFLDPRPDSEEEEWARRYGIQPMPLPQGDNLYLGAVVISAEREVPLPVFDPSREAFLEYDITQAISRTYSNKLRVVGAMGDLPGASGPQYIPGQGLGQDWVLFSELKKSYTVQYLQDDLKEVPPEMEVLLVIHPKRLPPQAVYALDQFVMRGGRLLLFLDPFSRSEPRQQGMMGPSAGSDLPELLSQWGIGFTNGQVVGDHKLATTISAPNMGQIPFPVWPTFGPDNVNHDSVITSRLNRVILVEGGAFSTKSGFHLSYTPLLTTSKSSGMVDTVMSQFAQPMDISGAVKPDNQTRDMAVLLSGKFDSAFAQGPPLGLPDPKTHKQAPGQAPQGGHLAKPLKETSVLLVGDADFINDRFAVRAIPFVGGQTLYQPLNDNLSFVLNAVEFLSGSQELIRVRSRGDAAHPFTTVQNLMRGAQEEYQQREAALRQRLNEVEQRLSGLQKQQAGGNGVLLTPDMVQEVERYRDEERRTRRELRDVRKVLRHDIETLGNVLLLVNLLLMPLLVTVAGVVVYRRRIQKAKA